VPKQREDECASKKKPAGAKDPYTPAKLVGDAVDIVTMPLQWAVVNTIGRLADSL